MDINISKKNKNSTIALIGAYPPPYGGVSVHIQRMKEGLEKRGYKCIVYNLGKYPSIEKNIICIKHIRTWLLKYLFLAREDVIHFHDSDWRIWVIAGLLGLLNKKVIISIHGASLRNSLKRACWFQKRIIIFTLRHVSFIIVVNLRIKELLISIGIKPENIVVIPAFIPPTIRDEDIKKVPQEVWDFIDRHNPIISGNAFKIIFYNNQDLYGIDMCIDLCANLKKHYPNVGFVFGLPDIGEYNYFKKMQQKIQVKGIENNFLFQTKPCQFYPIIMKSDVFIRPTNTDGASVSLREALYFKVPSLASNITSRPKETILFENRNINDFTSKAKWILDNYKIVKERLSTVEIEDNSKQIIEIYRKLL